MADAGDSSGETAHPDRGAGGSPGMSLVTLLCSTGLYPCVSRMLLRLVDNADRRALIRAVETDAPMWLLLQMLEDSGLRVPGRAMAEQPELTAFVLWTLREGEDAPAVCHNLEDGLEHHTDEDLLGATEYEIAELVATGRGRSNLDVETPLHPGAGYQSYCVIHGRPRLLRDGGHLVGCLTPEYQEQANPLDDSMARMTMILGSDGVPKWVDETPPGQMEEGFIVAHMLADEENNLYVTIWEDLIVRGYFDLYAHDRQGRDLGTKVLHNNSVTLDWEGTQTRFCVEGGVVFSATPHKESLLICTWAPRAEEGEDGLAGRDYVEFEVGIPLRKLAIKAVEAGHIAGEEYAVATFGQDEEDAETTTLAVLVHRVDRAREVCFEVGAFKIRGCRYFGRNSGRVHLARWVVAEGRSQLLGLTLSHVDCLTRRRLHFDLGRAGKAVELFAGGAERGAAPSNRALKE